MGILPGINSNPKGAPLAEVIYRINIILDGNVIMSARKNTRKGKKMFVDGDDSDSEALYVFTTESA